MPIAEMPERGRMTAGEAVALTGPAPVPRYGRKVRGKCATAGGRQALRHVLQQAALAASGHKPFPKLVAQRLKARGKPHKLVIAPIARRLLAIANTIPKTGVMWRQNRVSSTQLPVERPQ
jgi:transposase